MAIIGIDLGTTNSLASIKEDAEKYIGEEVMEAVISVPAYSNDAQRKATKRAGELAGLKVEFEKILVTQNLEKWTIYRLLTRRS